MLIVHIPHTMPERLVFVSTILHVPPAGRTSVAVTAALASTEPETNTVRVCGKAAAIIGTSRARTRSGTPNGEVRIAAFCSVCSVIAVPFSMPSKALPPYTRRTDRSGRTSEQ